MTFPPIWTPSYIQHVAISPLASRRHVFIARTGGESYKLFQINFGAGDRSVIVDFPYFSDSRGIVSVVEGPNSPGSSSVVELAEAGLLTTRKVKYSHKIDGEAHFSQDGQVLTRVRNKAKPLKEIDGHMFTIYIKGYERFAKLPLDHELESSPKRNEIEISFTHNPDLWLEVIGRFYTDDQLRAQLPIYPREVLATGVVGPTFVWREAGRITTRAIITWPPSSPMYSSNLEVAIRPIAEWGTAGDPGILFLGGFSYSLSEAVDNNLGSMKYLALKYPCAEYEDLKDKLLSIDLPPGFSRRGRDPDPA